ncbi:MAG TPA: glycerol-3-phosphate dehydrogenase [Gammaproteobacteria bacterium]|nr:glycerol-3-phosphate dehydrogenase [Gammaproteobacteria bacterium]
MIENTDVFIIGGGINGAAMAYDAAGRGLSVVLCEKNDLASATSSASTKLIHGGLRYLEFYEWGLVRKALHEREILMKKAPYLVTPLQFILPCGKQSRPAWLMRMGLFLYDHLTRKNTLPRSQAVRLAENAFGEPLQKQFVRGFSYYDCMTDDARLTLVTALAANEKGAAILTRHEFISAQPESNRWKIIVKNTLTGETRHFSSKALINVSGPFLQDVQQKINPEKSIACKRVKGSHIIVPTLFSGDFAYILQHTDERIIFAIPYQNHFTLIGTTDIAFDDNPDNGVNITIEEKNYLCNIINHYFKKSITLADIVSSYSGVRCLQDEPSKKLSRIGRGYHIQLGTENQPPLLTLIGGKLTTHRIVAEEAIDLLKPFFSGMKPAFTAFSPLPGGDFSGETVEQFLVAFKKQFSWLPEETCRRYVQNYGTRANLILKNAKNIADLGEDFTNGFYEKELMYLVQHEWAKSLDDILWRRTKLGLVMNEDAKNKIRHKLDCLLSSLSI